MPYNQAPLKHIGDIRKNIAKNKAKDKNMSTQEMKYIVNQRFRESMQGPQVIRKEDDGIVKKVLITPGSPGAAGYKPIEEGISLKDIKKTAGYKRQANLKISQRKKADKEAKIKDIGRATGKAAKEAGKKALDVVSPLVPGLGKRRTFVSGRRNANARMVLGSGAAFNEAVDKPTNPRTGGERFRFGEWQKYKRETYTPKERRYNIGANIRNKGLVGLGAALVGHGEMQKKHGGPEQIFKLKDYKPLVGKMIKKGIKTFKSLM